MQNVKTRTGFTHESAYNESQEWYTPPKIFEALGIDFDIDVASPGKSVVPWIPTKNCFTFEDSGLLQSWSGRVWCNPPYGQDTAIWVEKFCQHNDGIMLVFARTDTTWFHRHASRAGMICFVKGRIKFIRADGFSGAGSGAASMLLACGCDCIDAVQQSRLGQCVSFIR